MCFYLVGALVVFSPPRGGSSFIKKHLLFSGSFINNKKFLLFMHFCLVLNSFSRRYDLTMRQCTVGVEYVSPWFSIGGEKLVCDIPVAIQTLTHTQQKMNGNFFYGKGIKNDRKLVSWDEVYCSTHCIQRTI